MYDLGFLSLRFFAGLKRLYQGSYNAVNGVPSCANDWLLKTMLRQTFGFNGYVTGDCGAVDGVQSGHHYTNNNDDTCAVVMNAGVDLDCGWFLTSNVGQAIQGLNSYF
jgi:hypothetical protein